MEEEKKGAFKIDLSAQDAVEEQTSSIVSPQKRSSQRTPDKKSHEASYIVLGFVAIAIIFIAGYINIKKSINAIDSSGSEEMQNLSKELNDKLIIVNKMIEDHKKELKENLSGIGTKIKSIESGVASVNKTEKMSRAEFQSTVADVKKEFDPLKKQINDLKKTISDMSEKSTQTSDAVEKIRSLLEKNSKDIAKLSNDNVNADQLNAALKKERESSKQSIDSLASEINSLKKSIKDLQDKMTILKNMYSSSRNATPAASNSQKTTPGNSSTIKNGSIIEEEIH